LNALELELTTEIGVVMKHKCISKINEFVKKPSIFA